jgi:predicted glutamine amidotransferase
MCRMVAAVFRDSFPVYMLPDLRRVAEVGKVPDQGDEVDGHRDGWGAVAFDGTVPYYLGRSAEPVHIDPAFDEVAARIGGLRGPNIVIVHARRGTAGSRSLLNTHPFIGDGITFAHNGTVREFEPKTAHVPVGETDSERVFSLLLDRYGETDDLRSSLRSVIRETSAHEHTGLIFVASDGRQLVGFRGYAPGHDASYYTLNFFEREGSVVFYQETRLDLEGVREVANGEMVSVGPDLGVVRERLY